MKSIRSAVSKSQFPILVQPLLGQRISKVWRGHGSAIFLEIGELQEYRFSTKKGHQTLIRGRYGISLSWSWRFESARAVKFGSWCTNRVITNQLRKLEGRFINGIELFGRLPEIQVSFSDGLWLSSFMSTSGQPDWCVRLPGRRLVVERGGILNVTDDEE